MSSLAPLRAPAPDGVRRPGERRRPAAAAARYLAAVALVAVTLAVAELLRSALDVPDPEMLFLLTVMISAVVLGRGPALLAAALGVGCYDYFFLAPLFTLSVSDERYFMTFAMMFGVGWVMSELTDRVRKQQREALVREARTAALLALTKDLASADEPANIGAIATRHAADAFAASAYVLQVAPNGGVSTLAAWPASARNDPVLGELARLAIARREPVGLGTALLPSATAIVAPLAVGATTLGVLAIAPDDGAPLRGERRGFLEAFAPSIALALGRARLADEARDAALRAKTEQLRASLLSAVSHDLRTPLAAITGAATSLRDDGNLEAPTRTELVAAICDEAERLERLVANLLDMTRLESGASAPRRDWVPFDEIVGSALSRLEKRLEGREVEVDVQDDLPLLFVDPVLFEQLVLNLLENATKYTPARSPIDLAAHVAGDAIVIEVRDRGPGLRAGDEERIFEKFHRGHHPGVAGVGLGLPICRAIADAHGGSIVALSRPGGGAIFRVALPITPGAPPVPSEGALA